MRDLSREIEGTILPKGSAAVWWLGQAGFAFKSHGGTVMYLDTYVSDLVERAAGFVRLSAAPIDIDAVRTDWFLSSHEHEDHLDTDAIPTIAANNPNCIFAGSLDCEGGYDRCSIPAQRRLMMNAGEVYDMGDVKTYTARADHGDYSPHALAFLLDFGGVKVMFTGDTCLNREYMKPLLDMKPDVVLPCINGNYGNLNGEEAAQVAAASGCRACIPCHFWTFKEHHTVDRGDPHTFVEACARICPGIEVRLLSPGRGVIVRPESIESIQGPT